jgi:hypothetical protein
MQSGIESCRLIALHCPSAHAAHSTTITFHDTSLPDAHFDAWRFLSIKVLQPSLENVCYGCVNIMNFSYIQ